MRIILSFAFLLIILLPACMLQGQKPGLDGRTFRIESFADNRSEGSELLTFQEGQVAGSECSKWGFTPAAYTCTDGKTFRFTLISPNEGKMEWEGKVEGKTISGSYVWTKAGQSDIAYTFRGEESGQ